MTELNGNGLIYVGIPRERFYIPAFVDNRDRILAKLHMSGHDCGFFQAEGHRVDRNRDTIVGEFLKLPKEPEWLIMLDSDMEHPEDICERLTSYRVPVVGGLYFHRGESHDPFAFTNGPETTDQYGRKHRSWVPMRDEVYDFLQRNNIPYRDGALVIDGDPNALVECDAVATGAICIHRSVLEAFKPGPWFEYKDGGHSEDLIFCADVKERFGFPIYCDLSTISGHMAMVPMGQAQFRMRYESRGINLTTYSKRDAAEMYSKAFDVETETAIAEIEAGSATEVAKLWSAQFDGKAPTEGEENAFYLSPEVGKAYVMELLHWNFTAQFIMLRQTLTHVRSHDIIEIGSGIGSIALQMILQKNNVVAVEINETLRKFIAMRYEVLVKNVESSIGSLAIIGDTWTTDYGPDTFDVALAYDVLEHLPEFQLRRVIKNLSRVLVMGGHLYYHGNWGQQDIYPMHHDYSQLWPSILNENGFIPISNMEAIKARKV